MARHFYTYLVRCRPTGKVYYGKRTSRIPAEQDLWKRYQTSSKVVARLITIYGSEAFDYEIRKKFTDQTTMSLWEEKVLKRMNVSEHDQFLNQWNTSANAYHQSGPFKGHSHSTDSRNQIASSVKHTCSTRTVKRPDAAVLNVTRGFNKFWSGKKRPDISNKFIGSSNPNAKVVITPLGNFGSLKAAGEAYQVRWDTVKQWIKRGKEGFYYG